MASLAARVNVQGTPVAENVLHDSVFTDIQIPVGVLSLPAQQAAWAASKAAIRGVNTQALIGTYLSIWLALPDDESIVYPDEALDIDDYTEGQHWLHDPTNRPEGKNLDYTQAETSEQMVDDVAALATARGEGLMYFDEVIHPDSQGGEITGLVPTWDQTMMHAGAIKTRIDPVKVYLNIAWAPGAVPINHLQVTALTQNCHGITLETGLYPPVGGDAVKLADLILAYQAIINADVDLIFIPPFGDEAEARFLAGFAMVLWGPLVSRAWFSDNASWHMWPDTYGAPTGARQQGGTTITREFGSTTFIVDCAARTVTISTTEPGSSSPPSEPSLNAGILLRNV